jgi:hypothetical protein
LQFNTIGFLDSAIKLIAVSKNPLSSSFEQFLDLIEEYQRLFLPNLKLFFDILDSEFRSLRFSEEVIGSQIRLALVNKIGSTRISDRLSGVCFPYFLSYSIIFLSFVQINEIVQKLVKEKGLLLFDQRIPCPHIFKSGGSQFLFPKTVFSVLLPFSPTESRPLKCTLQPSHHQSQPLQFRLLSTIYFLAQQCHAWQSIGETLSFSYPAPPNL